eukprot:TRINITY_DN1875_c0_g1_i1.p1 TRINITY_DN1875_c0_g1~~TRINITY_DN1875_c0_g1_i1.p1  ORF type:complete len:199 (+),score=32.49 TRINITY_DN1875_c0_g1_i1:452-1048(+)
MKVLPVRDPKKDFWEREEKDGVLKVPIGGMCHQAEHGIRILAEELCEMRDVLEGEGRVNVVLPAGTGTTAFYLNKHLKLMDARFNVYTVPVSGDKDYLERLFQQLSVMPSDFPVDVKVGFPHVLDCEKIKFAQPKKEYLEIWKDFQDQGICFDLIYAPRCWSAVKNEWHIFEKDPLIYIHTGGTSGNQSQLLRYNNLD